MEADNQGRSRAGWRQSAHEGRGHYPPSADQTEESHPPSVEVRRLLVWGVIIIGTLLFAALVFAAVIQFSGGLQFQPVDPIRLAFVIAGSAVAAILSLIALYSIIVKGHLAPFVSVMVLIAFGLSAYLIMSPNIGEMRHARGVITVIFTVGTISIAMILVMGIMFTNWPEERVLKRFNNAKHVLTMLLGILGTVVGFYFGSADDAPPSEPLAVTRMATEPKEPKASEEFVVSFSIDGGKPPFSYKLQILGPDNSPISDFEKAENVVTGERHIEHSVSLDNADAGNLGIRVQVTDSDQHETELHRPAGSWVRAVAAEPSEPDNE